MNLFPYEPTRNLLPFDGIVNYDGPILTPCEAEDYLEALRELDEGESRKPADDSRKR